MNKAILLVSTFFILVAVFIYAFGKEGNIMRVEADYCVSLEVPDSQTETLISELDDFSVGYGLTADKSSPVSIVYKNKQGDEVIILRILFGNYGSVLSHYYLGEDSNQVEFLEALKSLVRDEFENKYPVKECNKIDGFKTPEYILQPR